MLIFEAMTANRRKSAHSPTAPHTSTHNLGNSPRTPHPPDRPLTAFAWMTMSALGFSLMAVVVKSISSRVPQFELVFFRSILNAIPVWLLLRSKGIRIFSNSTFSKRDPWVLSWRGLAGFGSLCSLFYTLEHLPLTIAMMLLWCSPLFVILFSWIFLGEKLRPLHWAGVILAFAGLYLLLAPHETGSLLGGAANTTPISSAPPALTGSAAATPAIATPSTPWAPLALGLGLLSAALSASAYVAIRSMANRLSPHLIIFYFVGISSVLSLPLAAAHFVVPSLQDALALLGIGLIATFAQFTMTRAYQYAPAGQVSTMGLLNAAFSALWGTLLFNESLVSVQWAGMLLLVIGVGGVSTLKK